MEPRELLDLARASAVAAGLPGIYFVGNSTGDWNEAGRPRDQGYDALTGYFYNRGFDGRVLPYPENYEQLVRGYGANWRWIIANMDIPYLPPTVFGWDRRPWGIKAEYDACCVSTPDQYEAHLREAKRVVDANRARTKDFVMLCCWNEFGEGNYIEPTKHWGFQYLERIRNVFGGDVVVPKTH